MKTNIKSEKGNLLVAIILIAVVITFFAIISNIINKEEETYLKTQGILIANEEKIIKPKNPMKERSTTLYSDVYQYEVNGKKYKVVSEYALSSPTEKGKQAVIKYNPENPNESIIVNNFVSSME